MALNLPALFQRVMETASASDAKMFGVEVAIVTNVKDPDKLGRVKVCFPRLATKPESDWIRVVQPAAGAGRGFEAHRPHVVGSLWNGKDKPMKNAYQDDNTTVMIQTKSGHQVILDDKKGDEKIIIADKSGNRTLTWDVKNKKFLIECKEGDVEIHAEKKIVLECEDLEVKTTGTCKFQIDDTFDLKVKKECKVKVEKNLILKAQTIYLN